MKTFFRTYPQTDDRHFATIKRLLARKIPCTSDYLSWDKADVEIHACATTATDIRFLRHLNFEEMKK